MKYNKKHWPNTSFNCATLKYLNGISSDEGTFASMEFNNSNHQNNPCQCFTVITKELKQKKRGS